MADGNTIQTTMTLDQQQFMREMASQVRAIAKSAGAFVEFKKQAVEAGQASKGAFEQAKDGAASMASSLTGVTGAVSALLAGVKLIAAEWQNVKERQDEALAALTTPANEARKLKFNFNADASMGMDDLEPVLMDIAQRTETPVEQVFQAAQNAMSGKGSLENVEAVPFIEEAFRMYPADVGSAAPITDAGLDLAKIQKSSGQTIDPRAIDAWLGRVQVAMRTTNMKDTAKVLSPVTAAGQASGDTPRYMATLLAALTQRMGAGSHEQAATSLGGFIGRIKKFESESDQKRVERMTGYVHDVMGTIDLPGRHDAKKKAEIKEKLGLIQEQHATNPEAFADEVQKLIDEVKATFGAQSVYARRLTTASERIEKARTTLVDQNEHGNQIELPIAAVKEFQAARSTEQRKQVIQKFPILLEALMPELKSKMNVLARPHIEAFLFDKPEMMNEVKAAAAQIPDIKDELIPEHEEKLRKVKRGRFEPLASAERQRVVTTQRARLSKTFAQREAEARQAIEQSMKDAGVSWTGQKIVGSGQVVNQILPGAATPEEPERWALLTARQFLQVAKERLKAAKTPAAKQKQETAIEVWKQTIQTLETVKQTFDRAGQVKPAEPANPQPKPAPPAADKTPMPAGQQVGKLITEPIRQRLRPEIDFQTADTGDTIALQMALAQRRTANAPLLLDQAKEDEQAEQPRPGETPIAMPKPRRSGRERVIEDIVERALSTAEAENVPGVTREGLHETAQMYGDDTTAFAIKVKDYFHKHAEQRREAAKEVQVNVDPTTGDSGSEFKDPSVDRLFQAGIQIQEAPIREMQRTDRQRAALDGPEPMLVAQPATTAEPEAPPAERPALPPEFAATQALLDRWKPKPSPLELEPFDAAGFMADASPAMVAAADGLAPETGETPIDVTANDPSSEKPRRAGAPARYKRKPFVPSDPERFAKAQAAVERSHQPRAKSAPVERKPFVPRDPERTAKAWAAVERSHQPRPALAAPEMPGDERPAERTAPQAPTINVQGGDTKPVVSELSRQTLLLEQIAKSLSQSGKADNKTMTASRGGRERTSTRPAAALATS